MTANPNTPNPGASQAAPAPQTGHAPQDVDLPPDIPFVAWLVKELQPATFVQLGTQSGNLYFAACQTVAEDVAQAKASLVEAQANAVEARANAERARRLLRTDSMSKQQADQYFAE